MLLAAIVAAATVLLLTPAVMSWARSRGVLGPDVRKPGRPLKPEMGGLAILAGISAGIVASTICGEMGTEAYPILATIWMVALVGALDDLKGIRRRWKPVLVALASAPAAASMLGDPEISLRHLIITFPPLVYYAILVPLGVTGAANAVNMLAGYNGLEAGEVAIASLFAILLSPPGPGRVLAVVLLASSISFLVYNWYPARTFIGDVGTLTMGAALALVVILSNIEAYGVILIAPTFYELFSTVKHLVLRGESVKRIAEGPEILPGGRLKPPRGWERLTLPYLLLSVRPVKEWVVVLEVYLLFLASGLVALLIHG